MILNSTPVRTSKSFKINDIEIEDVDVKIQKFDGLKVSGDIEKFSISNDVKKLPLVYGIGKKLENQVYNNANQNINITFEGKEDKDFYLEFNFDDENDALVGNIEINAKENSKATIIIKYISDGMKEHYNNSILKVCANEFSEINVVIVNMLNNKSNNFLSIENTLHKKSHINYTVVDFGGKASISNYYSNLIGQEAKSNINTIYLGTQEQLFDINYIAELKGEKSNVNIEVQGALNDSAKKNFKGTIDFKKGCKKSVGNENEFCMLLSDKARSKGLPMLLCTEEDVEGNHSSAAGKVDRDMVFYIMSRGFSYKETMKLIVKAKFNNIIEGIKDEIIKEEILNEIDKRI